MNMFSNILVPIDISYGTNVWQEPALKIANQIAQLSGGRIHALTVVPLNLLTGYYPDLYSVDVTQKAKMGLEKIVKDLITDDTKITLGIEHGGICAEILRVADELPADLIVMASHGPVAKDYLLGSNAAHVTLHARCPVFIMRECTSGGKRKKFMEEAVSHP